jgi:hypothetical protein
MTNPDYERGFYQHITASFFLRLPWQYWQERASDYLGTEPKSIAAASILARSYEKILYDVKKRKFKI